MNIQQNLLDEVFKACINDSKVLDVVSQNLTSEDIPRDLKSYDAILAILKNRAKRGKEISLGIIQQDFSDRGLKANDKIFDRIRLSKPSPTPILLEKLTEHIRQIKSLQLYEDFAESYRKGDKNEAVAELVERANLIQTVDFSIPTESSSNPFTTTVELLGKAEREYRESDNIRMPFFIPPIDKITHGGMDRKDTALFIMRSGEGKSTILKTIGSYVARNGFKGLHFQLEGGDSECQMNYNRIVTGIPYHLQRKGEIQSTPLKKKRYFYHQGEIRVVTNRRELIEINQAKFQRLKETTGQYDLEIVSYETLGGNSTLAIETKVDKWIEEHGCKPDFIIVDSIDLLQPPGKYGYDSSGVKARMQASATWFKNKCTEWDTRGLTSTQTGDLPMEKWNDPDFVITRSHALGDKNIANSFSHVFSGNRTIVEKRQNLARIFCDKLRHADNPSKVIMIKTAFDAGKYFDIKGTIEKFENFNDPAFIPKIKGDEKEKS